MTKGKTLRQIFLAMLLILPLVFIMSACGHEHKYSEEWSKNAMEHWHVCTDKDCNEISDKAKHVYGEWQIVETATCTENGKRVKACSVCGYILEEQVIPAKNHNYGTPTYTWSEDKATCTAKVVCSNDTTHVITETVEVAKNTTPATCEADGNIEYTATFTNTKFTTQTKSETINKLGHDYVDGTCTRCGDKRFAQIGEKYYASLQDAVKGAVSGDTITLLANVSLDNLISVDKNLTIDFGGFTLSATSGVFDVAYNTAESKLILKNGKIDTEKWGVWLQKKGYLKVENDFEIIADNTGKVDTAAAVVVSVASG